MTRHPRIPRASYAAWLLVPLLSGCAITTGLNDGDFSGSIALAFYQLRGDSKVASATPSSSSNPLSTVDPVSMQEFGLGTREDDIEARISWERWLRRPPV